MTHLVLTALLIAGTVLAVAALRFVLRASLILAAMAGDVLRPQPGAAAPLAEIIPFPVTRFDTRRQTGPRAAA